MDAAPDQHTPGRTADTSAAHAEPAARPISEQHLDVLDDLITAFQAQQRTIDDLVRRLTDLETRFDASTPPPEP